MTTNVKVISKPKVRFCQFSENATMRKKEEVLQQPCKQQAAMQTKNGPRIKEIVSLKKPIRIVDCAKSTRATVVTTGDKEAVKRLSLSTCNAHLNTTVSSAKDVTEVESAMILRDVNGCKTRNIGEESGKEKEVSHTLKERAKCLGKENQATAVRRPLKRAATVNETRTARSCTISRGKFKPSPGDVYGDERMEERAYVARPAFKAGKPKMARSASSVVKARMSTSVLQEGLHRPSANPATILPRVTSSLNYKTAAKNRRAPVKKRVLRNVVGPKIKTSVESRIFDKEQADTKASAAREKCTVASDILVQDLTQPEYNSIICTITKLKELKQQKRVTDVTHLPSTLKSFLHGKISTALDFPLDEAIYKNLVDLSIDERHLPRTVKRSKDPEPRQKDLVPKLADFFIPEDTREIYEAVHVKSRVSKIDDDWNAFKISDRILEWKYSIDAVA